MTVYIDELKRWAPSSAISIFLNGSAHLTADTLDELHAFAASIGLRRAWFQDHRVPHYDLTTKHHAAALRAGAVFVPAKEQARRRIQVKEEPGLACIHGRVSNHLCPHCAGVALP
jgi:hypothetical protein